ncbi:MULTISPECIES: hypothetical protein [unclassified Streptomyces]|uniref:hypothetical protein n=1 Tax=unclassified Streptomyces TaxID=2593676 RepID=UPI00039A4686|nr:MULTISPECIES: hypothetical protein [unclassified Streptomyces]
MTTRRRRDRSAVNARLPAVSLGTVDPTDVPNGYALQISLGPLDSLVDSMRLARAHKYALLLKMAQRLHQAGRADGWPTGPTLPARLTSSDRSRLPFFTNASTVAMVMQTPVAAISQRIRRAVFDALARAPNASWKSSTVGVYDSSILATKAPPASYPVELPG